MKKNHSMRSALGQARGLGSAKSGYAAWLDLRVSSLALIPLSLYFVIGFVNHAVNGGYSGAHAWLQSPLAAVFVILSVVVGLQHGAKGMKEVIEDYCHNHIVKMLMIFVVFAMAAVFAVLGTLSVGKIFFGE